MYGPRASQRVFWKADTLLDDQRMENGGEEEMKMQKWRMKTRAIPLISAAF